MAYTSPQNPHQNSVLLLDYKKCSIIENLFLKPFSSSPPSINHRMNNISTWREYEITSPIYRTCSLNSRKCGVPCQCHSWQMLNSVFRVLSIPYTLAHHSREPFTSSSAGLPPGPLSPSSLSPCSIEFLDKAAKCCDSLWVILYLYANKKK